MTKRANDTPTLIDRIEENTIKDNNGCWIWQLSKNNIGYGMMRAGNKMRTVHRVSYEEYNNVTVPRYTCVIHTCEKYDCVNPDHLFLGTRKDLTTEMIRKGKHKFWGGSRKGIPLPKSQCPHCQRFIANNLYERHHNHNCKSKPKSINTLHSGNTVP